ncbi:NTPase [Candidatus Bathyarchaeota archaeon]|nr:NTPase [Candidatus Bathyarchaeota archaeon]
MKRIFLITGPPRVGKTTVLTEVAERLRIKGFKLGGMISRELRRDGIRVGFEICDYISGKRGWLAHIRQPKGPRIGKYRVNLDDLDFVGVAAIHNALREADVVLIDEIGPMELYSRSFIEAVEETVNSGTLVLATIHYRAQHPLVRSVKSRKDVEVINVTEENRGRLPQQIAGKILNISRQ